MGALHAKQVSLLACESRSLIEGRYLYAHAVPPLVAHGALQAAPGRVAARDVEDRQHVVRVALVADHSLGPHAAEHVHPVVAVALLVRPPRERTKLALEGFAGEGSGAHVADPLALGNLLDTVALLVHSHRAVASLAVHDVVVLISGSCLRNFH